HAPERRRPPGISGEVLLALADCRRASADAQPAPRPGPDWSARLPHVLLELADRSAAHPPGRARRDPGVQPRATVAVLRWRALSHPKGEEAQQSFTRTSG